MAVLAKYSILDNLIEGVQIISPDFRYLYVNNTVTDQGKTKREKLLGFTMMECYPGIEHTAVFKSIEKCMNTAERINLINEFKFPDDTLGYFELRMQRIEEGVLLFSYDVTDQKRAEMLIKRSNSELEQIVKERTKELDEKNDIIQQQLVNLESLNQTKNKFFGIMAHDLKSPMNSLKMFSKILVENIETFNKEELLKVGKEVQDYLDNTIKMADNLIKWAKLQMNTMDHNPKQVPVEECISSVSELLKPVATKKDINLTWSCQKELSVFVDKNHLEFILRNLISNAIKFTPPKGKIDIQASSIGTDQVRIEVIDNGVGIQPELLGKLFSIAGNKSTRGTNGEKGTGLGLMLCHEFVALNKGKIDVNSQEGFGSTFSVVLKAS